MKKLINSPENVVVETMRGMALAHADLIKVRFDPNYIIRADAPLKNKVAIISGGADSAVPLIARKGRASYLGERSANHADPGCASSVLLFETLREAVRSAA